MSWVPPSSSTATPTSSAVTSTAASRTCTSCTPVPPRAYRRTPRRRATSTCARRPRRPVEAFTACAGSSPPSPCSVVPSSTAWPKWLHGSGGQHLSLVSPLEGFGHSPVVVGNKCSHLVDQLLDGCE